MKHERLGWQLASSISAVWEIGFSGVAAYFTVRSVGQLVPGVVDVLNGEVASGAYDTSGFVLAATASYFMAGAVNRQLNDLPRPPQ